MIAARQLASSLAAGLVAAASFLSGCASTDPSPAFDVSRRAVFERTFERLAWDRGGPEDAEVDRRVRALLSADLTPEAAVAVALLRNRGLLATYEDLGVGQADLVQAGLLSNPVFSAGMTTAERNNLDPNLVLGLTDDFLTLLMLPAKKKIAAANLARVEMRVADEAMRLAFAVRSDFIALQGAQQIVDMRREIADAASVSLDLLARQHDAGSANELDVESQRGVTEQIQIDLARSEGDVETLRERLNEEMGLWGTETRWRAAHGLPEVPKDEVSLDRLESLAMERRLDLAADREEVRALGLALSLTRSTRWTGAIGVGVEAARLSPSGTLVLAPSASIELPLFDQRQAAVARLSALERQSRRRLEQHAIGARAEVRTARARLSLARDLAQHYRATMIPLRERIVLLSQQEYDAMLLGVYQLLAAKESEVNAYREYIEVVRDYWVARSDLERATGGALDRPHAAPSASSSSAASSLSSAPAGAKP